MLAEVCRAISTHQLLHIDYGGTERVVEPHCHGWLRSGREAVLVYQRAGSSVSGHREGWKTLLTDKVVVLDEISTLATAALDDNDRVAADFARVHCSVEQ